ncbi:DUF4115 domain-containing protein [Suttonella sp. R2A3]|uniref:RodZ domain-containing protein n=1 Tax=Suttonella sp. R2A3 TaxID=2908648 RepID=UPI001F28CB6F|nr:RodZ domain-containing protein [Suttonella sp. R2A3]UJF23802.1 DUF4115 domain-containing protein [Suttonella sp. R2A3]
MKDSVTSLDESSAALDIGQILRQAREARDITIASAAMQTNLRGVVIEQLEENNFEATGAPVFTRGYLSIYARFLELEEDKLLVAYNQRDSKQDAGKLRLSSVNVQSQQRPYKRSYTRQWVMLGLLLILGGVLMTQLFNDQSWLIKQIQGAFATQEDPVNNGEGASDEETSGIVLEIASEQEGQNSGNDTPGLTLESVGEPVTDDTTTLENNDTLSLSSLDEQNASSADDIGLLNDTEGEASPQSSGPALVVTTAQENWIEVKNAGGEILHSKIYQPGSSIELTSDSPRYSLNIGRPDAVTLMLNGEERPLDNFRQGGHTRLFEVVVSNE